MPSRRSQGQPPIESKRFTLEEIENGIRKLRRRIEEVRAIDPKTTRYDDPRVDAASRNIKADISEIFGRDSPEYRAHGAHSVGNPEMVMGMTDEAYQRYFTEAGALPLGRSVEACATLCVRRTSIRAWPLPGHLTKYAREMGGVKETDGGGDLI